MNWKNKKKWLCVLLAICMLLSQMTVTALADDECEHE